MCSKVQRTSYEDFLGGKKNNQGPAKFLQGLCNDYSNLCYGFSLEIPSPAKLNFAYSVLSAFIGFATAALMLW